MAPIQKSLEQTEHFYYVMRDDFLAKNSNFNHSLNAFVTSARSIRHVISTNYKNCVGFTLWWDSLNLDARVEQFENLRNISLKEGPLSADEFVMIQDFGPGGLTVKGISHVKSDVIRFDEQNLPIETRVFISDEDGERTLVIPIINDFTIHAVDKKGVGVEVKRFLSESKYYLEELTSLVQLAQTKFENSDTY